MHRIRPSIRLLLAVVTVILYAEGSPAGPSPAAQQSQQAGILAERIPLADAVRILEPPRRT